jgi:hypothetical protein
MRVNGCNFAAPGAVLRKLPERGSARNRLAEALNLSFRFSVLLLSSILQSGRD